MTEEENWWFRTKDFTSMFEHFDELGLLDNFAQCRKFALFQEAPRPWRSMEEVISEILAAIERGEQRSDPAFIAGLQVWNQHWSSAPVGSDGSIQYMDTARRDTSNAVAEAYDWDAHFRPQEPFDVELLRDIFGNPFRPVTFAAEWRTEAAVGIASQMYDSRDFGNMPILADALQDAGCELPEILNHCREPGTHVRGCWVVDLVLGKS